MSELLLVSNLRNKSLSLHALVTEWCLICVPEAADLIICYKLFHVRLSSLRYPVKGMLFRHFHAIGSNFAHCRYSAELTAAIPITMYHQANMKLLCRRGGSVAS